MKDAANELAWQTPTNFIEEQKQSSHNKLMVLVSSNPSGLQANKNNEPNMNSHASLNGQFQGAHGTNTRDFEASLQSNIYPEITQTKQIDPFLGSDVGSPFLPPSIQTRMLGLGPYGESPLYKRPFVNMKTEQEFSESYLNQKIPVSYVDHQDLMHLVNQQSPKIHPGLINSKNFEEQLTDEEIQKLTAGAKIQGQSNRILEKDLQNTQKGDEYLENEELVGLENVPNYEIEFNFEGFKHQDLIERNLNMQCFLQTYTSKECIVCHPMLQQIYMNALHPERAFDVVDVANSKLQEKKFNLDNIIQENLKKKYMTSKDFYNVKIVNDIIYNEATHIVAVFKDYLIFDDLSEFLKRFYDGGEAVNRLPKICEFYERYSKVFPNYVTLPAESKIMYKNIERKQKIIDDRQRTLQARMQVREQKMRKKIIKLNGGIVPPEAELAPIDVENYESSMSWFKNSQRFFDTKFLESVLKQDPLPSSNTQHSSFIQKSMLLDRSQLNKPNSSNMNNNSQYQQNTHLNINNSKGRNHMQLKSFAELNLEQLVQAFVSKDQRNDLGQSSMMEQQDFTATLDVTMPSFHHQDEAEKFMKAMVAQQQKKQKELILHKMQQRKQEGTQKLIMGGNPKPQILAQQQVKLIKADQVKQTQAVTTQNGQRFIFNTNGVNNIIQQQQKQILNKATAEGKKGSSQGSSIIQNVNAQNQSPPKTSKPVQEHSPFSQTFNQKEGSIAKQFQTQQHHQNQKLSQTPILDNNIQGAPPSQLSHILAKQQVSQLHQSPTIKHQTSGGKKTSILIAGSAQKQREESQTAINTKPNNVIKKKIKKTVIGSAMTTSAGLNQNHHQQPDFKIKHGLNGIPSNIAYNQLAHSSSGALTHRENLQKKLINNLVMINQQPNYQNDFSPLDIQDLTANSKIKNKQNLIFNYNSTGFGMASMATSQHQHGSQSARVMANDIKQINNSRIKQNISLSRDSKKAGSGSQLGTNLQQLGEGRLRKSSKDSKGIQLTGGQIAQSQNGFIPNMKGSSSLIARNSFSKQKSKPAVLQRIDDLIRGEIENAKAPTEFQQLGMTNRQMAIAQMRSQSPDYYYEESKHIDASNTLNNQSNHLYSYSNPQHLAQQQQQIANNYMDKRKFSKQQQEIQADNYNIANIQQHQHSATLSHGNSGYNSHQTNTVQTIQYTDNSQIGFTGANNNQMMKVMQLDIADISTNLNNNSRNFLARQQQQQIQLQKQTRGMNPRQKSVPKNKQSSGQNMQNMIFIGDPNHNPQLYGQPQLQNINSYNTNINNQSTSNPVYSGRQSPTTARNNQFANQFAMDNNNILMNSQFQYQHQYQNQQPLTSSVINPLVPNTGLVSSQIGVIPSSSLLLTSALHHHNSANNRYENSNMVIQNNRQIIKKVLAGSKQHTHTKNITPGQNQKSNSLKRVSRGDSSSPMMDYQIQGLLGTTLQNPDIPSNTFSTGTQRLKQERQSLDRPAKLGIPYQQQMNLVVDTTVTRDSSKRYSLQANSGPQSTKGPGLGFEQHQVSYNNSGSRVRNISNQRDSNTIQIQQQQQPKKIIIGKKTNIFGTAVTNRKGGANNL